MSAEIKLSEILPSFEAEVSKFSEKAYKNAYAKRWSVKRACNMLLMENFNEVVLIFKRILSNLNKVKITQDYILANEPESRPVTPPVDILTIHKDLMSHIRLDIKTLYLFTAQITDILRKCGNKVVSSELERISLFRHNLITHVHDTPFFKSAITLQGGVISNLNEEKFEVLYLPLQPKKNLHSGFQRHLKKISKFIPELESGEINNETITILYRKMDDISDKKLKREAKKYIFKVGVHTDPLGTMCVVLYNALKEYRKKR